MKSTPRDFLLLPQNTVSVFLSYMQMRLDFNTFVIAGPSTSTLSIGKVIEGELNAKGSLACARGQCQTDTFSVVSNSVTPPVICGTNSGEHSKTVILLLFPLPDCPKRDIVGEVVWI